MVLGVGETTLKRGVKQQMKLTREQLETFDRDGYLLFPDLFSKEEIKILNAEVPSIYKENRPEVTREKNSEEVRTAFGTHLYNKTFAKLAKHPRLVAPVVQILNEQVYMHQFKINGKAAFKGEVWQWHQDYATWKNDDDMPEARAMNIAIFLDEVNEFNGPLMFIPGSHKKGVLDAFHDTSTTNYPLWCCDEATVTKLVERGGIVAPKGKAGTAVVFHGCMVHCSSPNLSPWHRKTVYLSLCAVTNHIRQYKRAEYRAHRDFKAIECLKDDCLLDGSVEVPTPWALEDNTVLT